MCIDRYNGKNVDFKCQMYYNNISMLLKGNYYNKNKSGGMKREE
ncbi:hypothetical protein CLMAG_46490 [Clostridium magnum DSM 2767]|uniref:Uncharacterized protein n=1 Tax=Clostridium magnum DSM 2767 TaxID=1121326 RepID=A0A161X7P1_9CLOT|nr:hypothetical protein CLMAG_46490 [Clostridium magnum DSM 2767]